jgi:hypothetical protein
VTASAYYFLNFRASNFISASPPLLATLAIAEQFYRGWSAVITPAGKQVPVGRPAVEYGILAVDVARGSHSASAGHQRSDSGGKLPPSRV